MITYFLRIKQIQYQCYSTNDTIFRPMENYNIFIEFEGLNYVILHWCGVKS